MTVQRIKEIADRYDFSFTEYEENGVVCGYEMETWTDGGIHMCHFIDCRNYADGLTADNILAELVNIYRDFDVDDEIVLHLQSAQFREAFTIQQALEDLEDYEKRLYDFALDVGKEVAT